MHSDGSGYFLYHSIGQYPGKPQDMAAALARFSEVWGACDDGQWEYALGQRAAFIDHWRNLIGGEAGTVTTCESVTAGLYTLIGALPSGALAGKRLLVAGDCFPSLHFLLSGLAPRFGFTLDTVPMRPGASWVEDDDVIAAWGADVGLALLTWVSSTSSHRVDLDRLVAHGRQMGSLIGVDITQAAGLLPFSVTAPRIDFSLSTSLKWMCGTPGAGMLYVAPDLIAACQPEFRGWFSQANPFSWDLDSFAFAPDIRRFDTGTPSIMPAVASVAAFDWFVQQDRAAMLARNRAQVARILHETADLDLPLRSPADAAERGGSVMWWLPEARPAATVLAALRKADVFADARGQLLRVSPGVMTTDDGVSRLISTLRAVLRG